MEDREGALIVADESRFDDKYQENGEAALGIDFPHGVRVGDRNAQSTPI